MSLYLGPQHTKAIPTLSKISDIFLTVGKCRNDKVACGGLYLFEFYIFTF